jgi:hypothetical protein
MDDLIECEKCNKRTMQENEVKCAACWWPFAKFSPPARAASADDEKTAIRRNFSEALLKLEDKEKLLLFEKIITEKSFAVISVFYGNFNQIMQSDKIIYQTYANQRAAEGRTIASPEDDKWRRGVDAVMYGEHGENIVTAALSLNFKGLPSYGDVYVKLDTSCIAYRSAVLIMNSYDFVDKYNMTPKANKRPLGFLSTWDDRGLLAAFKHAETIAREEINETDFEEIILQSDGDRRLDIFLEVHFYGGFNRQAIEGYRYKDGFDPKEFRDKEISQVEDFFKDLFIKL